MTIHANGHTAPVTLAPLPACGPVSGWPQQDDPERSLTAADSPERRWRGIDGDTAIRVLAAIVVLAVAAFAAIVSYSHIFELGRHHGQDGAAARLLPLSVDGLIAAASLVMLHAARRKLDVPQLARWMLALGVGATVAANVEYGMPFGWLAAVVSAWPAVAFVGSVEMAVRFIRDARQAGDSDDDSGDDSDTADDRQDDDTDDKPLPPPETPRQRQPRQSERARAAAILKRHPDWTDAKVAEQASCHVRTVQRARSDGHG